MLVSVLVIIASIALIYYQIWQTEHIQSDIFSLYAYLSHEHIQETYFKAQDYLIEIVNGSFIKQISPKGSDEHGLMESLNVKIELESLRRIKPRETTSIYSMMVKRAY